MDTETWLEVEARTLGTTTDYIQSMLAVAAKINCNLGCTDAYDYLRAMAMFNNSMRDLANVLRDIAESLAAFVKGMTETRQVHRRAASPQPELRLASQPWQVPRRCLGSNRWY